MYVYMYGESGKGEGVREGGREGGKGGVSRIFKERGGEGLGE